MSFDIEEFVARCRGERNYPDAPERIARILGEALATPEAIAHAVRELRGARGSNAMAEIFVNDEDLTIYQVSFPPGLYGVPHDHAGWAVIGVYSGAESFNVYEERDGNLRHVGRQVISAPGVEILAGDLVHDIENPLDETSGSIHVYANRHFAMPGRRIWKDASSPPEPFSVEKSFEYGMALTNRRRLEQGLSEAVAPELPDVESFKSMRAD